jgi:hypothetical protein
LDGIGELDIEIIDIGADAENNTTYIIGDVVGAVAANKKDAFPQAPIWRSPEKAFAQVDEDGDMEDRIGSQLVQLQPIDKN